MVRIAGSYFGFAQTFKVVADHYRWTHVVLLSDDKTSKICWFGAKSFDVVFGSDKNYTFTWLRYGSRPTDEELDDILQQIRALTRGFISLLTYLFTDHPRSGLVYNLGCICRFVCLSVHCMSVYQTITFESLDVGRSFSHILYISRKYGSSSYMKVIGAKMVENPYPRGVKLSSATSPVLQNIQPMPWSLCAALGFGLRQMWMVWPQTLSRDRKWPRVTKFMHSPVVVGLRLEKA